ncbi:uncharacterized protein CCOS01_02784 [Colletotrichum costaricense]|uniref:Secreted protein n=1 Tax=Colletotrichum costaricense TaxID=1209916 RepID=A0AAI9Z9Y4_9PEZI|nr:uncharacterized protein CCOS01_02784 [Colletotrichum costaricense]KAK1537464.1 hypothetical protein CCOS01_02784 [Colletotrichum costaricense]
MDWWARICFMIFLVFSSLVYTPCTQHHLSIMAFPPPPHRYLPRTRTVTSTRRRQRALLPRNVGDTRTSEGWCLRKRSRRKRGGETWKQQPRGPPPVIYLSPSSNVPPAIPRVLNP